MGFIIGALFGLMAAGGPGGVAASQIVSQVPIRCLAALEDGDEAYAACRLPSLFGEINRQSALNQQSNSSWCDDHFHWGQSRYVPRDPNRMPQVSPLPPGNWIQGCDIALQTKYEIKAIRAIAKLAAGKHGDEPAPKAKD